MAKNMFRSLFLQRFDASAEFTVRSRMTLSGRTLGPGDPFDKSLCSTRRLRQLYETRRLIVDRDTLSPAPARAMRAPRVPLPSGQRIPEAAVIAAGHPAQDIDVRKKLGRRGPKPLVMIHAGGGRYRVMRGHEPITEPLPRNEATAYLVAHARA